jgi:Gpi18-like mannosyltransferase
MVTKNIFQKHKKELGFLIPSILIVFGIRFILSYLPSFGFDMGSWLGWAGKLASVGFSKFYSDSDWTQYTPGYLYWLWVIGKLGIANEFAIKIPVVIADIATGLLIWSIIRKVNDRLAVASFFLYTLNPVVIFDGSVWGQIDGLLTFLLFLSAYFLIEKKNFILSVFFWSIAFVVKPQSMAVAPVFLMVMLLRKFKLKQIVLGAATGLATIFVLSYPFFIHNPILGLPQQIIKMSQFYSYTSVTLFNLWALVGMWIPDSQTFLRISFANWGVILISAAIIFALFKI